MLLRLQIARLDFVSKLILLLAALVMGVVVLLLCSAAILFVSGMLAFHLSEHVGGLAPACGIIAAAYSLMAVLVYIFRQQLIVAPLARFIAGLLLNDAEKKDTTV